MKTKLTIFFIFTLFLLPSTLNSGRLHFGIISAIKGKVEELKEKKREATDIILAKNTKVLSSETMNNHVKTEGTIYYFNVAATEIGDIQAGDIIISIKDDGFLRKVTSVTLTNNQYVVDTIDTVLEEAFEKIDIEIQKTLTPADLDPNKSPRLKKGVSVQPSEIEGEFSVTLSSVVLYDQDEGYRPDGNYTTIDDQIIANGSMNFRTTVYFKLLLDWFNLKEIKLIQTISLTTELEIISKVNISIDEEFTLGESLYFTPIIIPTPVGFPIVLIPEISLIVGANASVGLEATTDITQETKLKAGIIYDNGIWNIVKESTSTFQFNLPTLSAEGDIKGYAGPKLALKIYTFVGPYVNVNGYLQLVAEMLPDLSWTLYAGLEGIGGVEMTILSFVKIGHKAILIDYKKVIASGPDNPPTVSITNPADGSAVSGTVDITADASDDIGIDRVIFYIDGVSKSTDTTSPYSYSWDTTLYSDGSHTVKAIAYDTINQTASDQHSVTVSAAEWVQVACGRLHTIARKSDETLWAWGYNLYGQLGLGDTADRNTPTKIGTDTDWIEVAGGYYYTIARKSDGTLWAWGWNDYGQLGLGDTTDRNTPTKIGTDTDWIEVAGGGRHTIARKSDGTLWAWGRNNWGQLGLGDTTDRNIPTKIGTDTDWIEVAGGYMHTIARKSDGTLWAWGSNIVGQLGLGDTTDRNTPTKIGTDTDWIEIACGFLHTIARKSDGTLWAWGSNGYGQLGLGDTTNRNTPTKIGTDTDWIEVACGGRYTIARKSDGTLWAWGRNNYGQLGLGDTTDRNTPTQVGP